MKLRFNGMNNKARPEAIPPGVGRIAVNTNFSDNGELLLPRPGRTSLYSGEVKWVFETSFICLFVEGGDLKRLNDDYSATTLHSSVGDFRMVFCVVNDTVYYSNGVVSGKIRNGVSSSWGTSIPPQQPDCTPVDIGGMFGGDYLVAITWIADEESGAEISTRVTVPDGGGIHLSNFPTPPTDVTAVAVYVTGVNDDNLCWFGEYIPEIDEVFIDGTKVSIPLRTQFGYPPEPRDILCYHYGRIYYAQDNYLFFTAERRLGLQRPYDFWGFDDPVRTVLSTPNNLFVGTDKNLFRITNIDGDGAPIRTIEKDYGTVKGSEVYDENGDAYCMSGHGFLKFADAAVGAVPNIVVTELSYEQVAIPFFEYGASAIVEQNGQKYMVFAGQSGTQNPLANSEYNASELARGSL